MIREPLPPEDGRGVRTKGRFWLILFVAALGLATAFYRLGARGLWGDEVWQVAWANEQSLGETFLRFTIFNPAAHPPTLDDLSLPAQVVILDNNPLSFLWTQLATRVGSSEFWVRFPAAVFGAASVLILFLLVSRVFGRRAGLLASVLLALAPYHVWYAQDARSYSALIFYSLLALYFLTRIMERPSWGSWLGFVLATTLNLYNHSLALLPLASEVLVVAGWAAARAWSDRRGGGSGTPVMRVRVRPQAAAIAGGALLAAVLSLPVIGKVFASLGNQGLIPDPVAPFQLTWPFVREAFGSFGAGKGFFLLLFVALAGAGLAAALSRRSWFGVLMLFWIVLPLAGLWISQPRRFVPLRYLLIIQPAYLLLVALGCLTLVRGAARLRGVLRTRPSGGAAWRWAPVGLILIGIALVLFPLTWTGYRVERGNDWSRMCSYLRNHARPGDLVLAESHAFSVMDLWGFKKRDGVTIAGADRYPRERLTGADRLVWYVALGTASTEARSAFLKKGFERIPPKAYSARGLLPAGFQYGGRLVFPNFEQQAQLFKLGTSRPPARIEFGEAPGGEGPRSAAKIEPGDHLDVVLSLPTRAPRVLAVAAYRRGRQNLSLFIGDRRVERVAMNGRGGRRKELLFPLLASDPETFLLRIVNEGSRPALVGSVGVRYAPSK